MKDSDIRILEAQAHFSVERPREKMKFGASIMEDITFCHVRVTVENRKGRTADGWGAMFLSDYWSFPDPGLDHAQRDGMMREIVLAFCQCAQAHQDAAHPLDLFMTLSQHLPGIRKTIAGKYGHARGIPHLAAVVCASPLDAALHDAFGIVNDIPTFQGYGTEHMSYDLSYYLGEKYRRRYPADYIALRPKKQVRIIHTVGGLDKLTDQEACDDAMQDGRPHSLEGWIRREGVSAWKVKLRGRDMAWDIRRVLDVYQVGKQALAKEQHGRLAVTLDTNDQCETPDYVVELLHKIRERRHEAYDRIAFVEQPTERDLYANRHPMHQLSALKPVMVDESLSRLEDMDAALAMGWSGVVVKTCKCHSLAILILAKAMALGIPYTIQDLTNAGIALLHSLSVASRFDSMVGVEANARQYFPETSRPEAEVHPASFRIQQGYATPLNPKTPGLGFEIRKIQRVLFSNCTRHEHPPMQNKGGAH